MGDALRSASRPMQRERARRDVVADFVRRIPSVVAASSRTRHTLSDIDIASSGGDRMTPVLPFLRVATAGLFDSWPWQGF
ncbi:MULTISPECIES: hypothetical protein [Paraburkholderia]|uniref:hypothetical protein n=1 Tax=Paraburkholderia TaxID=1822464 RepID=UPI0017BECECD|nr:hypothetical protein [Paraburkholderia podalyriae]MBB5448392.1 hypothetical protein [Paraburkholderia sp. WSM4177]MBB5488773.1 hypothetical protein [Paraburkholderia sp. WSM4180]